MADSNSNGKSWMEYLRLATPFMTLVLLLYANNIRSDITEIRNELFHHLTNSEIHSPKSLIVTRAEFDIYQIMRDKQMSDLKDGIIRIEKLLQKHMDNKENE